MYFNSLKKSRLKKLITDLLTGIMVLAICTGTPTTAFAKEKLLQKGAKENSEITKEYLTEFGSVEKPGGVAITKELQIPKGTKIPTASFTYKFDKIEVDEDTSKEALDSMPKLAGGISVNENSESTQEEDIVIVRKNTGNLLKDKAWPHAGQYVYRVTETFDNNTIDDSKKEVYEHSKAEYVLYVYIAEAEKGEGLYVKAVAAIIDKNDKGKYGTDKGTKVDLTVPKEETDGNNFKFVSKYISTPGAKEAPDPKKQSVAVSKVVSGDLASKTKYFPFEITIKENPLMTIGSHKAYICTLGDGTYTKVTKEEAGNQYDKDKDFVTFKSGVKKDISLKHGQYLVFMDSPQGSICTVSEKAVPGYKAELKMHIGGKESNEKNPITNTVLGGKILISEGGPNSAAFTNIYASNINTGIIIDNLPFITMILIAIGAFTVYIINKGRKRAS